MKVTHYQQMMAYLTRPGYNKGGKVLPKKKPQEKIKKRSRINYEKLKKYLDPESQMFIEKELGFAEGGRIDFDRGGMVKMLNYLETLPKGTKVTVPQLMEIAKKKKIKIAGSSLNKILTDIDAKQIAASGNETYQFGKERRDQVKKILKNITIEKALPGTRSGDQMTVKRRNKANKIAKILYERGDVSSPNYSEIKFGSEDYYKINARMNREIIKKKDGTLDFKSGREKPLRSDQQKKLKKRFPEADFSKGKYGFPVDSAEEQYAKRYFKQGYKETLKEGLTTKQIEDIKERFKKEIPKSEWNFLTKDNPKGFIYGLEGTGAGGKYEGMGNRIKGYLEGQPWFDKFAPGLNADRRNYLLTTFERVAQHEDKQIKKGNLKEKDRTYNRIKDKDGKIIGFKDNTPTGQGTKYLMTDTKLKAGNLSITQHPQYAGTARLAKYVEATKGLMIGGSKFNDLVNNVMKVDPATFGIMPFERHHIYGTAKDNFGGKPGEIMLLTRDQNRAVENIRKAYFRLPTSRAGPPISFEEADKQLKKIGAAVQLDGKLAGEIVSEERTILQAARLAGINKKALIKAVESLPKNLQFKICNLLKSGGLPGNCAEAIEKDPIKTSNTVLDETKNLKTKAGVKASGLARNIIRLGIVGEAGFLAGEAAIGNIFSGRPFTESLQSTLFMPGRADAARERRAGLTTREQTISDAIGLQGKIASLESQIEVARAEGNDASIPGLQKALRETKAELESPVDPTDKLGGTTLEDLTSPYSATNISRQRKLDNILDADKAKSIASQMTLRDVERGVPNIADYGEIDSGVSGKEFEPRKTLPTDDDFFAKYMRENLLPFLSEKEFSVDPIDPTDKLKSETIYDVLKKEMTPMDEFLMKGSDPRFAEQIYGTQGKFAGGGIAKLAGVDSGPAPKSGPTPQGLDFLMKRGR